MTRSVVEVTAPCRVDLAGGTLDIWPIGLLHRGARTLNLAVDVEVSVRLLPIDRGWAVAQDGSRIEVTTRAELLGSPESALFGLVAEHFDLPPVEAVLASASPRGAGLGASSALAVALIRAAERLSTTAPSSVASTVHLARDLEARLMGLPTGIQDHYPAMLGGALEIRHGVGGESVHRLAVDLDALGRSLVVAYSGTSHLSAANNFVIFVRRLKVDDETRRGLDAIADVATAMVDRLSSGELDEVGRLMSREWSARRRRSPVVSTPRIEEILEIALAAGAWGGKVCGAGGGGCVAILAPARLREAVAERLEAAGHRVLACRPTDTGLSTQPAPSSAPKN
jgi:D-glycero-alpha-D-manno-heptose-7-phosphate kinase